GGRTFYANDRDPVFPQALAPHVVALSGLNNLAGPKRSTKEQFLQLCNIITAAESGFSAAAVAASVFGFIAPIGLGALLLGVLIGAALQFYCLANYDLLNALGHSPYDHPSGAPDGMSQKIGLLEFDTFRTSDVSDYITMVKQAKGTVGSIGNLSQVHVNGGV